VRALVREGRKRYGGERERAAAERKTRGPMFIEHERPVAEKVSPKPLFKVWTPIAVRCSFDIRLVVAFGCVRRVI